MVIRDRNDDDKIVACVRSDGKYQWDMINGIYVHTHIGHSKAL